MALIAQLLMIVASAVPAVLLAWWLMSMTGLQGLLKAFGAIAIALPVAVGIFAALVALAKALKIMK